MKLKFWVFAMFACLILKPTQAQFIEAKDADMVGFYKVKSIKLNHEIDLNKDGKSSNELMDEYNDCQKESTMELLADHTAILKDKTASCVQEENQFTWSIQKQSVEQREKVDGKTVKTMKDCTFLVLKSEKYGNTVPFQITMTTPWGFKAKGMVGGLSDTTEEGTYNFKKTKKN